MAQYAYSRSLLPAERLQATEQTKEKSEDLAGSRWEGTIDWVDKRSTRNRTVNMPNSLKVTFKFAADGTCNGKAQPCKWEKKDNTVTITLFKTKKDCQASGTLVLKDDTMSGTWNHYGGFGCDLLPPPRSIKLKRHD